MKYLRIADANINRACEGLRVIEDFFRLFYNNSQLSEKIKDIRHKIRKIGEEKNYLYYRNSKSDIGKDFKYDKISENNSFVLKKNFKRVQESLRVLEELLKTENIEFVKEIKKFRFEIYEIEKLFYSKKEKFKKIISKNKPILYGIIDKRFSQFNHIEIAENMLSAGIKIIQLREKELNDKDFLKIACKIKEMCNDNDAIFIINDRVDIAILSEADGVHLGQNDIEIEKARMLFGEDKIYGLSTHNLEQVEIAEKISPDYIGFGPIFETKSKENPDPVVGIELLQKVKKLYKNIPIVAIGGINLKNIKDVICCKPEMICVMSGIISQKNIKETIKKYMEIIDDTIRSC